MKQRTIALLCATAILATGITVPVSAKEKKNKKLEKILEEIQSDYDTTMESLEKENKKFFDSIGDSYESYVKNSDKVSTWLETVQNACDDLYAKFEEKSVRYYKTIVDELDMSDYDAWDDATEDLYDLVYDDLLEDIYDDVYDGFVDDIYKEIYDDILDDQPDGVEYSDWSDVRSELYSLWSDGRSDIYSNWSDARSDNYSMYSDIRSAFYNKDYNVEDIVGGKVDPMLEAILVEIEKDFSDTEETLKKAFKKVDKSLGSTYDSYTSNYSVLKDWYDKVEKEEKDLSKRTKDSSIEYYRTVVKVCDMDKYYEWNRSVNVLYRRVYKNAYGTFYKKIYKSLLNEPYKKYYRKLLSDAKKTIDYSDWYETYSDFYSDWFEARSTFYEKWFDARSDFYSNWFDIKSGFYSGDTDVNDILNIKETKKSKESDSSKKSTKKSSKKKSSKKKSSSDSGVSKDLKEFLDSYESFMDEYIAFMEEYSESDNVISMMADYATMLAKYTELSAKAEAYDEESMSEADAAYYLEVMTRINKKLANANI